MGNEIFRRLKKETIVWKSVKVNIGTVKAPSGTKCLIKLSLPAGTVIYECKGKSLSSRKCRASGARVVEILGNSGNRFNAKVPSAYSYYVPNFRYYAGQSVWPESNFSMEFDQCTSGIHFFFSRRDAACWSG